MALNGGADVRGELGVHDGGGVFGHEGENLGDRAARRSSRAQDGDGVVVVFYDDFGALANLLQDCGQILRELGLAEVELRHISMILRGRSCQR